MLSYERKPIPRLPSLLLVSLVEGRSLEMRLIKSYRRATLLASTTSPFVRFPCPIERGFFDLETNTGLNANRVSGVLIGSANTRRMRVPSDWMFS